MSEPPVATVSAYTLITPQLVGDVSAVPMLKRAAIMCDRIFVDTAGLGEPGGLLERRVLNLMFGGHDEGEDLLTNARFRRLLLRPADFGAVAASEMQGALTLDRYQNVYEAALSIVERMPDEALLPLAKPWRGVDSRYEAASGSSSARTCIGPRPFGPGCQQRSA
jgi:hypothetical protein